MLRSSVLRAATAVGASCWLALSAPAQIVRPGGPEITVPIGPGGGGNAGGGPIIIGPGGGGPIIIGPGGGGGTVTQDPIITVARGALVGQTVTAAVAFPAAAGQPQTSATYFWSISGGRMLTDPRERTVEFTADRATIVTLTATVGANGTSYTPTATVTFIAAETAGAITAQASVATSAASVTASVPPAQNGDRTFRWTVSGDAAITAGQNTATVTLRPGTPGLKEIVCNVTLQNLVTSPVRAYLVVTGDGTPTAVTVNGGSGGGSYRAGSRVDVFADAPARGEVFDRWIGDTEALGAGALAPTLAHATITVPATPVTLTATYKAAPEWTAVSIRSFNPQVQAAANGQPATTVSSTLTYQIPAGPRGLVFLLHDSGGSGAEWFERPEQLLLARDLVAAGFGVAALDSLNRTGGTWAGQTTLATNSDALNHGAAVDRFIRDGALTAATPLFFLGVGTGGDTAVRFAEFLATARPARTVKGAVLYLSSGNETLAVTSRVPQFFALATNDETLGPAGLAAARENSQFLVGRGVATAMLNNAVSPVHPARFRQLGLGRETPITGDDAQSIWAAVKTTGALDPNNYVKTQPATAALTTALPAAFKSRAADVAAQLAVASAGRAFYADANPRVIAFLNARLADAAVPVPGRLVNLSTRSEISYLGDTFTMGFTLTGPQRATVLLRGIGPGLARFGVANSLPALRLELSRGSTSLATNEAWNRADNAAQIATAAASVGAFVLPAGSLDTALLVQLDPGTYLATITGLNGAIGGVLGEIYDVSRNPTRLTNIAVLANITTPGESLVPGLVVAGNNPRALMVRAVGPSLVNVGLMPHTLLSDPRLQLFSGPQVIATNNNWAQAGAATLNAAFPLVGAFPLTDPNDAALVSALAPGSYTLQAGPTPTVTLTPGSNQPTLGFPPATSTGTVLVEVYELP